MTLGKIIKYTDYMVFCVRVAELSYFME